MTTQISQTGLIDLTMKDTRPPVINFPPTASSGSHFVEVRITHDLSILVTTAAEAQELEMRFAAARHYLSDEPVLPAGDLDDAGDDITDALVPVCGICGTTDPVLDVVTNSRAAGWRECRDLHACGDRVIAAAKATFVEVADV